MKRIVALASLMFSANLGYGSSCQEKLLGIRTDSSVFHIPSFGMFRDGYVPAKQAVGHLVAKKCTGENVVIYKNVCRNVEKGNPFSKACYLESNVGFFIVSRDLFDGMNIIFNRWD